MTITGRVAGDCGRGRLGLGTALAVGPGDVAGQQRTPEEYARFLEGAERVARMQVPRVVEALELKPGLRVADIGSGSGLFTRPIATRVAPGIVYAVDIDAALLKSSSRGRRRRASETSGRCSPLRTRRSCRSLST